MTEATAEGVKGSIKVSYQPDLDLGMVDVANMGDSSSTECLPPLPVCKVVAKAYLEFSIFVLRAQHQAKVMLGLPTPALCPSVACRHTLQNRDECRL